MEEIRIYEGLADFHKDRAGGDSEKRGFGTMWYPNLPETEEYLNGLVTAVEETGDVYAQFLIAGPVVLLGSVGPDDGHRKVAEALRGWQQVCSVSPESPGLRWIVDRLRHARAA